MPQSLPLITTIATALGLALILGFIAIKLKLPALIGYLAAGILLGPFTPGFVANHQIAGELAEIGVMLLMFGVGLHFSIYRLIEMRKIALPGAILQITVATLLGIFAAQGWGWDFGSSLLFGLSLSVASTVVLLRALETSSLLTSSPGQLAISWLIVEDLVMIIVLVLLPTLCESLNGSSNADWYSIFQALLITLGKVGAFIGLMLIIGRRILPKLLLQIAKTGSRELFTLCVVATAVSIAYTASEIFGMSFALGAFFSGMIMQESKFSQRAAEESLPLRDAFAVLFFVAVGMLFDPFIFISEPMKVFEVAAIIIIGKSMAAFGLMLLFRYPLNSALILSASLAQIGEFSFILAEMGVRLNVLTSTGQSLIFAGAIISISLNSLWFKLINRIHQWALNNNTVASILPSPDETSPSPELPSKADVSCLTGDIILVGYNRVGREIADQLIDKSIPFTIIEENSQLFEELEEIDINAVYGNACNPNVLMKAHIVTAGMIVITVSDQIILEEMINTINILHPKIEVIILQEEEIELIPMSHLSCKVFYSQETLAKSMSHHIFKRFGVV